MSLLLQLRHKTQSLLHEDAPSTSGSHHVEHTTVDDSDHYNQRFHGFGGCFGLPYQDHNYGAPPPPTPPVSPPAPPPPPVVKVNGHIDIDDVSCHTTIVTSNDDQDIVTPEDSVTRCICEFQHDDGYMICCDRCGVWQHVDCMAVDRLNIPDIYYCEKCEPRKVDKHRAIQLQTKRRELLIQIDSSATDTEDETLEGKKKKKDKAKQKKNKKDKKENHKIPGQFKGKFKFPKKQKLKDGKQQVSQSDDMAMLANLKKKLAAQTSPLPQRKKKFPKNHRSVSLDTTLPDDLMHGGSWSSPEANVHNGLASPPLSAPAPKEGPSSYRDPSSSGNQYSIEIETLLVGNKLNGQHKALSPRDVLSTPKQLLVQLCKVVQITATHKGLEALDDIATNQPIIEYKGSVMTKDQFLKENDFYARPHPHVLFYKFDDRQLCVDASRLTCDACYIRRSCTPNTEVRHVVDNGNLHFYLYSSRCISKGAEFTIPFDFTHKECSYNVECACSRQSCPIAKYRKNEDKSQVKLMRKKRRRSTKSQDTPVSESGPVSTSTPIQAHGKGSKSPGTITKRRKLSSFSDSAPNVTLSPEKMIDVKSSPHKTRSREDSYHKSDSREAHERSSGEPDNDEHHEDHKKMTREERKMDAILKAFEKMEKREERRKEALQRLDSSTSTSTRKSIDGIKSPTDTHSSRKSDKSHEVTTEEDTKPEKPDVRPKKGKAKGKKRRMSTPARRQSRANSSISMSAFDSGTSADESNTNTSFTTPVPSSAEPGSNTVTPSCVNSDKAFRFPKTKKYRLSEWLHETGQDMPRPLSIKTDLSDIDSEEAEFVKCVPSPHASSLSHLRRNSMSATNRDSGGRAVGSVGNQLDSAIGGCKKRWLRQAMFDKPSDVSMSPIQSGSTSPNPAHVNGSPGNSPLDFVTPLKKRRMARESVSSESQYQAQASLSPYPGMEVSDHLPEHDEDEEDRTDDTENCSSSHKTDHVNFKGGRNGLCQHVSQITPDSRPGNIFEMMSKTSLDGGMKRESFDSSLSESMMSPDKPVILPGGSSLKQSPDTKPFCPVLSTVKDEMEPGDDTKPVKSEEIVSPSYGMEHSGPIKSDCVKDEKPSVSCLDSSCSRGVKDEVSSGVVKQECDSDSVALGDSVLQDQRVSKGQDSLSAAIDSGFGGSPGANIFVDKSELGEPSNYHGDVSCAQPVAGSVCKRLSGSEAPTSSGNRRDDSGQPSSSSDQHMDTMELNSSGCVGIPSASVKNSFKLKGRSSLDSLVDSSEPEMVSLRTNLDLNSSGTDTLVRQGLGEQECDSTNRDSSFDGCQKPDNSHDSVGVPSCSSSQTTAKTARETNTELSSSSELDQMCDASNIVQSEADPGSSVKDSYPDCEISQQPATSHMDVSSDAEFQCSSSNTVEMISHSVSQSAEQISTASDSELQPSSASALLNTSRSPRSVSSSALPEPSSKDVASSLGLSSSHLHNSAQVDSTQMAGRDFLSSTPRREDGELDSSMSDMERDPRTGVSYRTCPAEGSSGNEAQPQQAIVEESEKEEGEITDDETEEECALEPPAPPTSTTSPTPSVHSATPTPSPCTEAVPTSSGTATLRNPSSEVNTSSPSSSTSNSFRWSLTSGRDRKEQDWGTPYRSSNNNNISSSSATTSRRERYSDYHRHSSSSTTRGSRSFDQRSPTRDDLHFADSSSSERSRHLSDDSNSNGLDTNISSTGCDQGEEGWRGSRRGSLDNSPPGLGMDNTSPISSTGLLASFQPTKKKMSLTEYKKRMKQKRPENPRSNSSSLGRAPSSNSGRSTPVAKENTQGGSSSSSTNHGNQDLITPLLPYFGTLGSSLNKDKGLPKAALPGLKDPKEDPDVHWNACATMAERIREQTQLSLTERLRREFGLDASESEEDEERRKERLRHASGGRPTSPAPPPPPPIIQHSKRDTESEDPLPPPPPPAPGSYPQHAYTVPAQPLPGHPRPPPNTHTQPMMVPGVPHQQQTFSSPVPGQHPPPQGTLAAPPPMGHPRGPPMALHQQPGMPLPQSMPPPAAPPVHGHPQPVPPPPTGAPVPLHAQPQPVPPPPNGSMQMPPQAVVPPPTSAMPIHAPPQPVPHPSPGMPLHPASPQVPPHNGGALLPTPPPTMMAPPPITGSAPQAAQPPPNMHLPHTPEMINSPIQQHQGQPPPHHAVPNFVPFDPSQPPPQQQQQQQQPHQPEDEAWDTPETSSTGGSIPSLMSLSFPNKYTKDYHHQSDTAPTSSTSISSSQQPDS